ncbi:MAG TPA: macro domain-containing protein [Gemmatimonadaceae bacterium]|nr:macro domain-containing protein [Gemmatimonadaceae bacterium]
MAHLDVRVDDLAFYHGDAIIRPVTADLSATTALLRRLEQAAGPELTAQLRLTEPLAVGSAIVTGAGRLEADLLVHAVIASDTEPVTESTVRRAFLSALERAEGWALDGVAVPPLGLGAGNLEIETSARVMLEALAQHRGRGAAFPAHLTIVVEREDEAVPFHYHATRLGLA